MSYSRFEGYILQQTQKAILFESHYWEGALWFPTSQIAVTHDFDSMEKVIDVKTWLCRKRGIYEFTHYDADEIKRIGEN